MEEYLVKVRGAICSEENKRWIIVTGNEACDLDSTVCALVYAYYKQMHLGDSATVIPLCQIERADIFLRTEVIFWLNQCNLSVEHMIFIDDLFHNESSLVNNTVQLILVDHNLPSSLLKNNNWPVLAIIDHHQEVKKQIECSELKVIETVGSCASLIALEILKAVDSSLIPTNAWKLLYGAILLDTIGLSDAGRNAGRLTDLDFRMANRIEDMIHTQLFSQNITRGSLFAQLDKAKYDVNGLSTWDLLRRDMKTVSLPDDDATKFICSTISGLDFEDLINRPDFNEASLHLCSQWNAHLSLCITVGCPLETAQIHSRSSIADTRRRAIIICNNEDAIGDYKDLVNFISSPVHNLMLRPITTNNNKYFIAIVNNIKVTRKTIIPILLQFLRLRNSSKKSINSDIEAANVAGSCSTTDNKGKHSATENVRPTANNIHIEDDSLNCGQRVVKKFPSTSTAESPTWTKLMASLQPWLSSLRPQERCEFIYYCDPNAYQSVNSPSIGLLNCLWTSLWRESSNASVTSPIPDVIQNPVVTGSETQKSGRSSKYDKRKIFPTKPPEAPKSRRFTVSVTKNIHQKQMFNSGAGTNRYAPIFHLATDNLSESDSEDRTPQWLETEYLHNIPVSRPSRSTYMSLDSVEAASFRLYRRLSTILLDHIEKNEFDYLTTKPSDPSVDNDQVELDNAELDLLRASMNDFNSQFIDKDVATSSLSNYWSCSNADSIVKQGLPCLRTDNIAKPFHPNHVSPDDLCGFEFSMVQLDSSPNDSLVFDHQNDFKHTISEKTATSFTYD